MIFNMAGGNSIKEASGTFAHPGTSEIEVSLGFKPLAVFTQREIGDFVGGLICDSKGEMIKYWYNTSEQQSAAYTDGMRVGTDSFFFKGKYDNVAGTSIAWYAVGI